MRIRPPSRGNHESDGIATVGPVLPDIEDVKTVVGYLTCQRNYKVVLVVAHSRGNNVVMKWMSDTEEGRGVSSCVIVAGRYRMEVSERHGSSVVESLSLTPLILEGSWYAYINLH